MGGVIYMNVTVVVVTVIICITVLELYRIGTR